MGKWTLEEIARLTDGQLWRNTQAIISEPASDSRRVTIGTVFVPLQGERMDGHDFISDAAEKGAVATLVRKGWPLDDIPRNLGVVIVDDPAEALQTWAKRHLADLSLKVVGITGSIGKTTTKEMTAAVLGERWRVLRNEGNLNTEIGLPLTVLKATCEHQIAVLEMGMRGRGEILQLTGIAQPDIAVITNVGETHIELLGSIENIALAKGEILQGMSRHGIAVLNADDKNVVAQSCHARGRIIWFSCNASEVSCQSSDVLMAEHVNSDGISLGFELVWRGERLPVQIPWPGKHNVYNAAAAVAVGLAAGMGLGECVCGLLNYRPAKNRLNIMRLPAGLVVIDDTYNAGPVSMRAALQVLKDYPGCEGRRIAVLGDMLELGPMAVAAHRELGTDVVEAGVDILISVGQLGKELAEAAKHAGLSDVHALESCAAAAELLGSLLTCGDLVLVKGSRGMQMERIVHSIVAGEGR